MRRKDREMEMPLQRKVLEDGDYGVLCLAHEDEAYGVPLSYVLYEDKIYFHGAKVGKKMDFLKENPRAMFVVVGKAKVPHLYARDEVASMKEDGKLGGMISKIFTTEFESVMVFGSCALVEDEKEKVLALSLLSKKYVPEMMDFFEDAVSKSLKVTGVLCFSIEEMTGKRKRV